MAFEVEGNQNPETGVQHLPTYSPESQREGVPGMVWVLEEEGKACLILLAVNKGSVPDLGTCCYSSRPSGEEVRISPAHRLAYIP